MFKKLNQFQIYNFEKIDSTNNEALRKIRNDEIFEKAIILTNHQTNGRGKKDALWISCDENIFLSLIFRIKNLIENFENFSILIAECLKQIIDLYKKTNLNFECKIKFPNDLLIDGKKFSGILPEIHFFNEKYFLIIGIGINWKNSPNENFGKIENFITIEKNIFIEEFIKNIEAKLSEKNFI